MTRTRIFISHSCKDVEIADDVPFEAEADPRKKRLKYARYIRDEVERLLGDDFEVLLDRKLLDPGDRWPIKLLRWLGDCDGAVLLLSEDAIKSKWVLQEATVLTWRRHLRAGFRLIPVRLGGLADEALKEAGFGPLQISDIQAAKVEGTVDFSRAEADALAARIAARFEDMVLADEDDEMRQWIAEVTRILEPLGDDILARTREPLGIADDDWAHFDDRARTVAHYLLRAGLQRTSKALERIVTVLSAHNADAFARLADKLLPMWVDPAAAASLAVLPGGDWHAYALNTDDPEVADDYLRRAWCCPPWLANRRLEFDEPLGEGQAAEALASLKAGIATRLRVPPRRMHLLAERVRDRPFFVIFGEAAALEQGLCEGLAADVALASATCLQLAGRHFERVPAGLPAMVRLLPALDNAREDAAYLGKSSILDLAPGVSDEH